jgi:hypothetical protein
LLKEGTYFELKRRNPIVRNMTGNGVVHPLVGEPHRKSHHKYTGPNSQHNRNNNDTASEFVSPDISPGD